MQNHPKLVSGVYETCLNQPFQKHQKALPNPPKTSNVRPSKATKPRASSHNHWISMVIMLQLLSLHHWCDHPPCIMFHDEDCIHKWWGYMIWSSSLSWYIHPSYYDIIDHCQPSLTTIHYYLLAILNHRFSSHSGFRIAGEIPTLCRAADTQVPLMNFMDQLRCGSPGNGWALHNDGNAACFRQNSGCWGLERIWDCW